jgi:hypothetical protein
LSDAGYFAKHVTLSLALRSSGDAGRGVGRVGAAAALDAASNLASTGFWLSCGFLRKSGAIFLRRIWFVIVTMPSDSLPADLAAAHAMILAQREQLTLAKSEVTTGRLEIERLKLMLAKARRERFGQSSERGKLPVEQLELAIEDIEETQAEQETKAEIAAPEAAKERRARNFRPPRRPLPDNLAVERIIEPASCACDKCGSERLHKLGEVVSKTLECEPRRWKIIEHVREKFSCRNCEAITGAGALPSDPSRLCRPVKCFRAR